MTVPRLVSLLNAFSTERIPSISLFDFFFFFFFLPTSVGCGKTPSYLAGNPAASVLGVQPFIALPYPPEGFWEDGKVGSLNVDRQGVVL